MQLNSEDSNLLWRQSRKIERSDLLKYSN